MKYYISDTHFGHYNIIKYCARPFISTDEMNTTIIDNWNSTVGKNDEIFILGDFSFAQPKKYLEILNGHKFLILGNHDVKIKKNIKEYSKYFEDIKDYMLINDNNEKIALFHYPIIEWDGCFRNSLHFYGHIHNNTKNTSFKVMSQIENAYNVGADILNFTPQTKENVIKLNKEFNLQYQRNLIEQLR